MGFFMELVQCRTGVPDARKPIGVAVWIRHANQMQEKSAETILSLLDGGGFFGRDQM